MNELYVIGAGGHGNVAADIARKTGYDSIMFLDDKEGLLACNGCPVIGKTSLISNISNDFFVALGNSEERRKYFGILKSLGKNIVTLIHPSAVIGDNVSIGEGTIVTAGAVVNPGASIGKGCIVNTCSSVDHDCSVGDFCHVSVGAHLAGTINLGNNVFVGPGVTVVSNVTICDDAVIGAGAAVISDITEPGTYVGVPARKVK